MTHDSRDRGLLGRWGAWSPAAHGGFLAFWLVFIVAGFGLAGGAFGNEGVFQRLHSGEITTPGENHEGRQLLQAGGSTGFSTYTLTLEGVDLTDPQVGAAATRAVQDLVAVPGSPRPSTRSSCRAGRRVRRRRDAGHRWPDIG